jgi:hypothetical protein
MHVDRKTFVCAAPGCNKRVGLGWRKKGRIAQWRCSEHLEGTEPLPRPQRPGKEAS